MEPSGSDGSWWAEAQELTDGLGNTLLAARGAGAERPFSARQVDALFRQAHTLKGLYRMLGSASLGELSHAMEEALDQLRKGRRVDPPRTYALLLRGVEALSAGATRAQAHVALDEAAMQALARQFAEAGAEVGGPQPNFSQKRPHSAAPGSASALVAALGVAPASFSASTETTTNAVPAEIAAALRAAAPAHAQGLSDLELERLQSALAQHQRVIRYSAQWRLDALEQGFLAVEEALSGEGELLAQAVQPLVDGEQAALRCDFYVALGSASVDPSALSERLARIGGSELKWAPVVDLPVRGASGMGLLLAGPVTAAGAAGGRPLAGRYGGGSDAAAQTVRVDIRRVDRLLNSVNELTNTKLVLEELSAQLASKPATASAAVALLRESEALERRLKSLQTGLMQVRMVAVGQLFERLLRAGQQAAHELGKEVRFVVHGEATELDKFIAEKLVDPLLHLVRNAVDHGIERPADRRSKGKPAFGTVQLIARTRGGQVAVQVVDDGAGIDVAAIRVSAVQRALVTPAAAAALDEREVLLLLCHPGFSTRHEVSAYSGRGVGLDVAKTELEHLGGAIEISTLAGAGATVSLVTPVTLAIVPALLVAAATQEFALPLAHVVEAVAFEKDDAFVSHGQPFLHVGTRSVPLVDLAHHYAGVVPASEAIDAARLRFVVLVGLGHKRLALLVDDLVAQRDIVVKSLGPRLTQVRSFAGAAELGGGRLILVLNTLTLLHDAELHRPVALGAAT